MGRLIGAAFLLPFLVFLAKGWIGPGLRGRLWVIFGLGALQGAIGWWMVASGLTERVEVSQYRLATHLILACVIFAATLWTASRLRARAPAEVPPRIRIGALALLVLVLLQIYLGAVVAGLRAGLIYNTWPLIDGGLIPNAASLLHETPWWRNLFENALTVQFNHRMVAYGSSCSRCCMRPMWRAPRAPARCSPMRWRLPPPSCCRPRSASRRCCRRFPSVLRSCIRRWRSSCCRSRSCMPNAYPCARIRFRLSSRWRRVNASLTMMGTMRPFRFPKR